MSFETWKAEYMPVDVQDVEKDRLVCLLRDEKKWMGLAPDILTQHGLYRDRTNIYERDSLHIKLRLGMANCSLCHHFYVHDPSENDYQLELDQCRNCPLYQVHDRSCNYNKTNDPWTQFVQKGDNQPMLELIRKAILLEKEVIRRKRLSEENQ